ncbi:hypothetical protein AURDEDRAFT_171492 [Auricularia subglabra TFB-10046 SS5]|nr:hypothetical protein AURDEDRAFT_171492 [Auricularia subglabra TFB-10046 SS5]
MSAAGDPAPAVQALVTAWAHQQGNYKFQTASYALYCYDHLLVLSDEVEKIWTRRFTFASLLYVLNRYITHIQFIAIPVGFYEKTWTEQQCDRFVKFPGAGTTTVFGIAESVSQDFHRCLIPHAVTIRGDVPIRRYRSTLYRRFARTSWSIYPPHRLAATSKDARGA